MPAVNVLIKPASGNCNMRCRYCFYADEMENRSIPSFGVMDEETMECIVRELFRFAEGACMIAFQGGEPTLAGLHYFQRFSDAVNRYNTSGIPVSYAIQTNGYYLDRDWCTFFKNNRFLVGISIDGIGATHDAFRKDSAGQGTYTRVLRSAKLLQEENIPFNILTVVNRRTAMRIHRIYESYRKHGFEWQQYIACISPFDGKDGKEYDLDPEEYGRFLIELYNLWEDDYYHGKAPYIRQFDNYISILSGQEPESCEQRGICSFQSVIEADGSVYPCDFYVLDEYRMGNLKTDSFETIVERWQGSGFVQRSANKDSECLKCTYIGICRGGCYRNRLDSGRGVSCFCKGYKLFFDACIERLQKVAMHRR